jgi:arylsulfatase A-like enzyme
MALHYASTAYVDTHFKRLLDYLDESGLKDNTLVVFTTDHGISQMRSKNSLYDQGTEVALSMRLPSSLELDQGYAVEHLTQNMDLFPTFMEAAGLECPEGTEARSLWPLLRGEKYTPHEAVFLERNCHGERYGAGHERRMVDMWDPTRAVRTNEYLYIRNLRPDIRERRPLRHELTGFVTRPFFQDGIVWEHEPTGPRPEEELYHITYDPVNQNDVADRPEYAGIKKRLSRMCDTWMEKTDDFCLRGEQPQPHREQNVEII